jgi:hypothetical protein
MSTAKAAHDALDHSSTGFAEDIPPEDIPGVHPIIVGKELYDYMDNLPSLPIPTLNTSLTRWEASLHPLLAHAPHLLHRALAAVDDFRSHEGPILQQHLIDFNTHECGKDKEWPMTHWLEKSWDTLAYLSDRVPLPLNVNCMGTLFECTGTNYPTWRCGAVLYGLMRFDEAIRKGTLSPEALDSRGKTPLCMWQYLRLYRHSRIPTNATTDEWKYYPNSRHVAVLVRSRWYQFNVLRMDGTLLSASECVRELDAIRRLAEEDDAHDIDNPNMCTMTCNERQDWFKYRQQLLLHSNATAATTLERIESAIFHISLSMSTPDTSEELMNIGCTGNGSDVWMDKSFTMIVTANGKMVFNMEHSHADAPMHSRMIEYMKHVVTNQVVNEFSNNGVANAAFTSTVVPLRWGKIMKNIDASLEKAALYTSQLIQSHQMKLLHFPSFGKTVLKSLKASPDSFIQNVLQLAFYRDQSRFTATYETGTTRAFHHGRTETIRSLTTASRALCLAMEEDASNDRTRYTLLREALAAHGEWMHASCQGMGVDRHFLALRMEAIKHGMEMPKIFTDESFGLMNTFELSTSAMAVTHCELDCFFYCFIVLLFRCFIVSLFRNLTLLSHFFCFYVVLHLLPLFERKISTISDLEHQHHRAMAAVIV